MYTPEKTVSYENLIGWTAAQAMAGAALFEGPMHLELAVWCEVPASWSKKKRQAALAGTVHPTTKPDADNLCKAFCDAMNGVVWKDDVQVVSLYLVKRYADAPCVAVTVRMISEGK